MSSNWRRRLLTCPLTLVAMLVWWAASPVLFLAAAVADVFTTGSRPTVRFVALISWWLFSESFGIVMLSLAGAFHLPGYADRVYRVQSWWMVLMLGGFCRIYGIDITLEGLEHVSPGPVHVLSRHSSLIDTVMIGRLIANPLGLRLRYVFKKELLMDPTIDIFGNHVPNVFVDRQSADSAGEIDVIERLAQGCGPLEGVVIYPEGTLFTKQRLQHILRRLQEREDPLYAQASVLRHLLPPRPGGALALLNTNTDIIFVAHAGFGEAHYLRDYLKGKVTGCRVQVRIWRVPAASIPTDRTARLVWLYKHWTAMDCWIDMVETRQSDGLKEMPLTHDDRE